MRGPGPRQLCGLDNSAIVSSCELLLIRIIPSFLERHTTGVLIVPRFNFFLLVYMYVWHRTTASYLRLIAGGIVQYLKRRHRRARRTLLLLQFCFS